MFGLDQIYWVLINSTVAFIYLFIISKILGKKQIAQLEFIDYAVGISLGSIASEMATSDMPFYHFLIAMTIFFLLAFIVAYLGRKSPLLKRILKGKPSMLIYEGKINYKELCKANIDINDLLSMLREKNYFDINDVEYAVFEPSGELSVLPKGEQIPPVITDVQNPKSITISQSQLTNILIIDGKISFSGLNEIGKDKEWLFKKANIQSKKDLKNIALALLDDNQDIVLHYKKYREN